MKKQILQILFFFFFGVSCLASSNTDLFGCRPPQNSRVKEVFTTKASITWDAVSSATGYKIRLRREGSPTWELILNTGFTHGFTFFELDSCTTYEYVIKASCPDGESGFSEVFSFTTDGNCMITDTKVSELVADDLKVFPNPASDLISIKIESNNTRGVLRILNGEGQKMMERSITSNKSVQIKTDHLAPGIYWCQFYPENGSGNINKKLLIQR